jgi:hypothetical protein
MPPFLLLAEAGGKGTAGFLVTLFLIVGCYLRLSWLYLPNAEVSPAFFVELDGLLCGGKAF